MVVKSWFDKDFVKKLNLAVYEAIDKSYVEDIVNSTPVDTGVTRNSWDFYPTGFFEYKLVNTNGPITLFLELGTGVYGPRKRYITPVRKKVLRWYDKKSKTYKYAKRVKGIKPYKFIKTSIDNPKNLSKFNEVLKHRLEKLKKSL